MTFVLLLVPATIMMSQVPVPQRWEVIVITVVLGAATVLP